jgi:hypothetical protein
MEPGEQSQKNQGETMGPTSKRFLKVRIPEGGDPGEWELFAPDGAPIEGWYQLSVGRVIIPEGMPCMSPLTNLNVSMQTAGRSRCN